MLDFFAFTTIQIYNHIKLQNMKFGRIDIWLRFLENIHFIFEIDNRNRNIRILIRLIFYQLIYNDRNSIWFPATIWITLTDVQFLYK